MGDSQCSSELKQSMTPVCKFRTLKSDNAGIPKNLLFHTFEVSKTSRGSSEPEYLDDNSLELTSKAIHSAGAISTLPSPTVHT